MTTEKSIHVCLRLYISRATPHSERAEANLKTALKELGEHAEALGLEVVDVFTQPRRAITDGVIVTPTLIGLGKRGRMVMIGDLADTPKLRGMLNHVGGYDS